MKGRGAAFAALAVAAVCWGLSFPFGKVALRELAPTQVVFLRFLVAAACFAVLGLRRRLPLPRRDEWLPLVWTGFLMVPAVFLLQFEGLDRTSVTRAALIVGAFPVLMAVWAVWRGGERLSRLGWSAVAASTLGVALTVGAPGGGGHLTGDLLVLGSVVMAVWWVVATRRLTERSSVLLVTLWGAVFGTLQHGALMLLLDGPPSLDLQPVTWAALAGLGLFSTTLAYGLWNWGQRFVPASTAGVFVNLEPLIGACIGILSFGDPAAWGTYVGGVLIVGAAFVVARER